MRRSMILMVIAAVALSSSGGVAGAKKSRKALVTFEATGSVTLFNPLDIADVGVTRAEFESACAVPTATQGLDGYVIELPKKVSAVTTRVSTTATSVSGVGLIDLFFFGEDCTPFGHILGSDDFDPLMYPGTRFVLVTNWFGDPTEFTFSATEVR